MSRLTHSRAKDPEFYLTIVNYNKNNDVSREDNRSS